MHLRRVLCSVDDDSNLVHVLLLFRHVSVHGRMLDAGEEGGACEGLVDPVAVDARAEGDIFQAEGVGFGIELIGEFGGGDLQARDGGEVRELRGCGRTRACVGCRHEMAGWLGE